MQLKTILNRVQKQPGFVYGKAEFVQPKQGPEVLEVHLEADALSECSLEEQRFVTPTLRRLWEEKARIDALTSQRIDALRREAEAKRPPRIDPPARVDPPTAQGSLFPQGSPTGDGPREDSRKRPGPPSAHSIHSTLAALQKYPWFIVKTRTRDYVTGAEEISFEVRDKIQVGSHEPTVFVSRRQGDSRSRVTRPIRRV